MRVALVSEHASPLAVLDGRLGGAETGGQAVHVAELARHLADLGIEVTVHTRRDDASLPTWIDLGPRLALHHLDAGPAAPVARDRLLPLVPAMRRSLAHAWRTRPVDVAHGHFWMSGLAVLGAAPPDAATAVTFHALGSVKQRHQGDADTSPASRIAAERAIADRVDAVIATCSDEVRELAALGTDVRRAHVVPCGVSAAFSPHGPRWPHRTPGMRRVVSVSRLVPRKGVDDLIRAVKMLDDVELVVVGGGAADVGERRRLDAVAAQCGIAERVCFLGALPPDRVAAVMRSADVVACAPWYEPFGIVPLEAMACGVPVVGTSVGGLLDTVVPGTTGELVAPHDPIALAAAIAGVLADTHRHAAYATASVARAERYRWPVIARRTLAAYQDALVRARAQVVA